jgi:tetratricopeptide (TPR) repeat protein
LEESARILDDLVAALQQDGRREAAATALANHGLILAFLGYPQPAEDYVQRAKDLEWSAVVRVTAAVALAAAGDFAGSEPIIDNLETDFPKGTLLMGLHLPTARAILALKRGDAEAALDLLRPSRRYELSHWYGHESTYIRSLALLSLGKGEEAAAELEKIIQYWGIDVFSVLQPLAHLGLARAKTLSGNQVAARKHYQDFLALWKDADPDIPVLQEARAEYERSS